MIAFFSFPLIRGIKGVKLTKKTWKEIPIGGMITTPGSSMEYHTGAWKAQKPVIDEKKCIQCLICFASCPDNCFSIQDGKRGQPNLNYCKGCGICANVCPTKAISMKKP